MALSSILQERHDGTPPYTEVRLKRLLIRPGAIGDFIVSLPALESLRSDYTEVWCPSVTIPLARFADRAISIASSGIDRLGLVEAGDVIERLRGFDEIHSWYGTNRPDFREFVFSLGLPFQFYNALPNAARMHAVDYYLAQVNAAAGAWPRILLQPLVKESFAVLHPFSGSARKNWPMARWLELAKLLEARMPVRWCCGPEDDLPGAVVIPDLGDLAQWLAQARVFIGNDSGITHLAATVGTETIALFGPTNAAVWAPRGDRVTVICNPRMEDIAAESVAEAVT